MKGPVEFPELKVAEPGLHLGLQAGEGHGPGQVARRSQRGLSWEHTQEAAGQIYLVYLVSRDTTKATHKITKSRC